MYIFFLLMFAIRYNQALHSKQSDPSLVLQQMIHHVSALMYFVFYSILSPYCRLSFILLLYFSLFIFRPVLAVLFFNIEKVIFTY